MLAGWALQAGDTRPDGGGVVTSDPMGAQLAQLRAGAADSESLMRAVLALPLWPDRLGQDADFAVQATRWLRAFAAPGSGPAPGPDRRFRKGEDECVSTWEDARRRNGWARS